MSMLESNSFRRSALSTSTLTVACAVRMASSLSATVSSTSFVSAFCAAFSMVPSLRAVGLVTAAYRRVGATPFAARRRMRAGCPLPRLATAGGPRISSPGRGVAARHSSAAMDGPRGLFVDRGVHGAQACPSEDARA